MGSTCNRLLTFSGCRISSAAASSLSTSCSICAVSIVPSIFLATMINTSPNPTNRIVFNSVTNPRIASMAPTRYRPLGTPNNWLTSVVPKSASLLPLVTRIPVDSEINREGIWLTRPSPIVRIAYLFRALVISMPCLVIPMMIPPTILMVVISRPATASPFTYFTAPSMEPKKLASSWIFSLLFFASASVMAPVFRSASIAICLPGIASRVNLAVTSDTRSEPLLMTINWIRIRMMKIMTPMTRSPPPTNSPKVSTTLPALPSLRIRRVDEVFSAIRKIVVNSSIVGKKDISRTSLLNIVANRIVSATEILIANRISSSQEGIGTINMIMAAMI